MVGGGQKGGGGVLRGVGVGLGLFFFFFFVALHLEKLEASRKIYEVVSSHTYVSAMKGVSSAATV